MALRILQRRELTKKVGAIKNTLGAIAESFTEEESTFLDEVLEFWLYWHRDGGDCFNTCPAAKHL